MTNACFEECRNEQMNTIVLIGKIITNEILTTIGYKVFYKGNGCHLVKTKSEFNIIQSIFSLYNPANVKQHAKKLKNTNQWVEAISGNSYIFYIFLFCF